MDGASLMEKALAHYGKKGMKWGVRNDEGHVGEQVKTKSLDKLDKKWDKENTGQRGWAKAHNKAADKMNNGEIDRINNKPEHKAAADAGKFDNWDDPTPELTAYMKDMDDAFNTTFNEAAVSLGSNPSGTKRYEMITDADGNTYAELVDIKHAAAGDVDFRYKITKDAQGRVTGYTLEEVELKHYGKKGMKWGVRNNDPVDVAVAQPKPGKKVVAVGGKNQPASDDAKRAAAAKQKAKASTTDALSNQELKALVERMNLEANYSRLTATQKSKSRLFVESLFKDKRKREQTLAGLNTAADYATVGSQIGDAIDRTDLSGIGK